MTVKYAMLPVPIDTGPESWDCEGCNTRPSVGVMSLPEGPSLRVCLVCLPNGPMHDFQPHIPWCSTCLMFHKGTECR